MNCMGSTSYMSFLWKAKDEFYLVIGIILLIIGFIFDLAAIMIAADDVNLGIFGFFFFTGVFIVPGLILTVHGSKVRKKQDKLEKLQTYLNRDRRVKVSRLASMIEENELETVALLEECMEKDMFQGTYEEEDGEQYFIYTDYSY